MGSRTSPYLQEKLALLGSLTVFNQVPELLQKLLGINANQSQTYRVCQTLSRALDGDKLSSPSLKMTQQQAQPEQIVYGMVDAGPPVREYGLHRLGLAGDQIRSGVCCSVWVEFLETACSNPRNTWPTGAIIRILRPLLSGCYRPKARLRRSSSRTERNRLAVGYQLLTLRLCIFRIIFT